jgi:hypothetical protein
VTIRIESIEGQRESACSGVRQAPRHILRYAYTVGADDDPQSTLGRALHDLENVAT